MKRGVEECSGVSGGAEELRPPDLASTLAEASVWQLPAEHNTQ